MWVVQGALWYDQSSKAGISVKLFYLQVDWLIINLPRCCLVLWHTTGYNTILSVLSHCLIFLIIVLVCFWIIKSAGAAVLRGSTQLFCWQMKLILVSYCHQFEFVCKTLDFSFKFGCIFFWSNVCEVIWHSVEVHIKNKFTCANFDCMHANFVQRMSGECKFNSQEGKKTATQWSQNALEAQVCLCTGFPPCFESFLLMH